MNKTSQTLNPGNLKTNYYLFTYYI
ncbi:hypothetical protein Avbf_05415 [Armadillidium vulgare]|nr:hypothetical protein Avbf_05415 [Armadillidium vulgare]